PQRIFDFQHAIKSIGLMPRPDGIVREKPRTCQQLQRGWPKISKFQFPCRIFPVAGATKGKVMTDDTQLLARFATGGDEDAFRVLIDRHLDLVYSAALRLVNGDAPLAEDVAQSVFMDLARKAGELP